MQLLVHGSGAAVALRLYLARRCLTRDHPQWCRSCRHCPVTFTHAGKLAGHLSTVCRRGAGKDVYAYHCDVCVVKCFGSRSTCVGLWSVSTASRLTGQAATTRTITITQPHLTAHSLSCTRLCQPRSATCVPRQMCAGPHCKSAVSSLPTAFRHCHSAVQGPLDGVVLWDRQCSVAACRLLCRSSIINWFSGFDHRIWR